MTDPTSLPDATATHDTDPKEPAEPAKTTSPGTADESGRAEATDNGATPAAATTAAEEQGTFIAQI